MKLLTQIKIRLLKRFLKENRILTMEQVELNLNDRGRGAFVIKENGEQIAEMAVGIDDESIVVYHTEVSSKAEGRGLAKLLLQEMVAYAREKQLKVIPLCAFVYAQFKRHPETYADLWTQRE